jgi:hypothetical protein
MQANPATAGRSAARVGQVAPAYQTPRAAREPSRPFVFVAELRVVGHDRHIRFRPQPQELPLIFAVAASEQDEVSLGFFLMFGGNAAESRPPSLPLDHHAAAECNEGHQDQQVSDGKADPG